MEIKLERLLGSTVRDVDGRTVGRIEEIHARRRGGEVVVTELVLGTAGLIERLSLGPILLGILRPFYRGPARHTVGTADMDLRDPERPCLRGRLDEIERAPAGRRRSRRRSRRRASA